MEAILIRAGCFVAIIFIGFGLKKLGFFKESDFPLMAKLTLKVALPAAIISSFSGKEFDLSLLTVALVGLAFNVTSLIVAFLAYRRDGKELQAFGMVNLPGYNIGCFALPFVQGFLGPMGVIATSFFDSGNAVICLGGGMGFASMVLGGKFSWKRLGLALGRSPAFLTYMAMVVLAALKLRLPGPVVELAGIMGSANTTLAMLMLGVGFRLELDKKQLGTIAKHLCLRYSLAVMFACLSWFVLPYDQQVRQVLAVLAFSPIGSAAPGFTGELGGDTGLASTINSLAILISIPLMVAVLLLTSV